MACVLGSVTLWHRKQTVKHRRFQLRHFLKSLAVLVTQESTSETNNVEDCIHLSHAQMITGMENPLEDASSGGWEKTMSS